MLQSLWNMRKWFLESNCNNDAEYILMQMSQDVGKGGCYKLGNLACPKILAISFVTIWKC
eukprot:3411333-Ditylum_brightwellii.AAC.1